MYGFYLLFNRKCSLSVLWPNSLLGFMSSILTHLLRESLMTSTGNGRQWEIEVIYWNFFQDKVSHIDSGVKRTVSAFWIKHSNIYIWFIFTLLMLPFKNSFLENFMLCAFSDGFVKPATILLIHHLFVNVGNGVPKWHLPEISVFLC